MLAIGPTDRPRLGRRRRAGTAGTPQHPERRDAGQPQQGDPLAGELVDRHPAGIALDPRTRAPPTGRRTPPPAPRPAGPAATTTAAPPPPGSRRRRPPCRRRPARIRCRSPLRSIWRSAGRSTAPRSSDAIQEVAQRRHDRRLAERRRVADAGQLTTAISGRAAACAPRSAGSRMLLASPRTSSSGTCASAPNSGHRSGVARRSSSAIAVSQTRMPPPVRARRIGQRGHAPPLRVAVQRQRRQHARADARRRRRGRAAPDRRRRSGARSRRRRCRSPGRYRSAPRPRSSVGRAAASPMPAGRRSWCRCRSPRADAARRTRPARRAGMPPARSALTSALRPECAAAGIVRRHHAPPARPPARHAGKSAAGAHQPGQAQQRGVARRRRIPFVRRQRQPVPGRDAVDYRVHCASRVGVASPRRAR